MGTIRISEGLFVSPFFVVTFLEGIMDSPTLQSGATETSGSYAIAPSGARVDVFGTGLTFDTSGWIDGGEVTAFSFVLRPGYFVEVTGLSILGETLAGIRFAETSSAPSNATESWFMSQDWTILSNSAGHVIDSQAGDTGTITLRGNDSIVTGFAADVIRGAGGDDTIKSGQGNDTLRGGPGDDRLFGQGNHDRLFGGDGNDTLIGGSGQDTLVGGHGSDGLDGGPGDDTLRGGSGADVFVLKQVHGRDAGTDIIHDFEIGIDGLKFVSGGTITFEQIGNHLHVSGIDGTFILRNTQMEDDGGIFLTA